MPMDFSGLLRRLLTDSHIYFALKVLLAIAGLLAFALATGDIQLTVLLSLGVVAGAIAETDDSLWGRVKNLAMTLLCFLFASLCVQYLFPTPWLFAIGLAGSTFLFVMVGALGQRYATISFGSLLIAIYTMLGAAKAPISSISRWPCAPGPSGTAWCPWSGSGCCPTRPCTSNWPRATSPSPATCRRNPASSRPTNTAPRPSATIWPSSTSTWSMP